MHILQCYTDHKANKQLGTVGCRQDRSHEVAGTRGLVVDGAPRPAEVAGDGGVQQQHGEQLREGQQRREPLQRPQPPPALPAHAHLLARQPAGRTLLVRSRERPAGV